jgi:hypothetical protein
MNEATSQQVSMETASRQMKRAALCLLPWLARVSLRNNESPDNQESKNDDAKTS